MTDKDAEIAALKAEVARLEQAGRQDAESIAHWRRQAEAAQRNAALLQSDNVPLANTIAVERARAKAAEARVAELEAGLKPFQSIGELIESETTGYDDDDGIELMLANYLLDRMVVGDFRRAHALLNKDKTNG